METGADSNNNDTLDDAEVTGTSYICNQMRVLEGDYTVNSQEDLDGMVYTEITGDVTIKAPDIENVDNFSSLVSIGGDLYIKSIDALTDIDGLKGVSSVGGDLDIISNQTLAGITALKSLTLDGNYTVRDNTILPACQARSIADNLVNNPEYTWTITISGNDDTDTCP